MRTAQEMDELKKEVGCTDYKMMMSKTYANTITESLARIEMTSLFYMDDAIGKEGYKDIVRYQKKQIEESLSEIARYLKLEVKKDDV